MPQSVAVRSLQVAREVTEGYARALDEVASSASAEHHFLRRGWYEAGAGAGARTLVGRRPDGTPFAALPLVASGRLPIRSIAGNYWPFRAFPVRSDADEGELVELFAGAGRKLLAPAWRLGPIYAGDPVARLTVAAARRCGWTVLTRRLGHTYVLDIERLRAAGGWPRKSTLSRTRGYERQLAKLGPVIWRHVPAAQWDENLLAELAAIEAASWVGRRTDGAGAKFLLPEQRLAWQRAARDPQIGQAMSALILYLGAHPIAFSFDMRCGDIVYGIASSYDEDYARFRPGKIVTWRGIEHWIGEGVRRIDWGAGDSGYKGEAGAEAADEIHDYLIVENLFLAALLRTRWETRASADEAGTVPKSDGLGLLDHGMIAAILATAAVAAVE